MKIKHFIMIFVIALLYGSNVVYAFYPHGDIRSGKILYKNLEIVPPERNCSDCSVIKGVQISRKCLVGVTGTIVNQSNESVNLRGVLYFLDIFDKVHGKASVEKRIPGNSEIWFKSYVLTERPISSDNFYNDIKKTLKVRWNLIE